MSDTAVSRSPRQAQRGDPAAVSARAWASTWAYASAVALILVFSIADLALPRGATAAIGYCLIPVILGGRRPRLLLGATLLCTVLALAGFWWEHAGAAAWMSMFDRIMVVGVLWLTFFLVKRRAEFLEALIERTDMLRGVTAELRRSNADLERFASTVAHDLRGPLNAVGMLAQLLASSGPVKDDREALESVDSIRSELRRMSGFIQSLLSYGRAGAREIEAAECDCPAVLEAVKHALMAEIEHTRAQVSSDPLPRLHADPVLMAQLFQNLIENSLKYRGDAPPRVHISATAAPDGSFCFSVCDNGVGIREVDRARIFTPFHQAGPGTPAAPGMGLGLATCKRIVERHGGRIWVESGSGAGTTFLFTIPQHPAPNMPQYNRKDRRRPGNEPTAEVVNATRSTDALQ